MTDIGVDKILVGESRMLFHLEAIFLTLDLLQIPPKVFLKRCADVQEQYPYLQLKAMEFREFNRRKREKAYGITTANLRTFEIALCFFPNAWELYEALLMAPARREAYNALTAKIKVVDEILQKFS